MRLRAFFDRFRPGIWLRAAILAVPILLVLWLLNQNLLLFRNVTYVFTPGRLGKILTIPAEQLSAMLNRDGGLTWRSFADTLVLTAHLPRAVDRVRVKLALKNTDQPLIIFSGRLKGGVELHNILSDEFFDTLDWTYIRDGSLVLWQRPSRTVKEINKRTKQVSVRETPVRQYASLADFDQAPPDLNRVAVFGVDPFHFYRLPGYQPSSQPIVIPHALRGTHQFHIYASHETVNVAFEKIDLNRSKGPDPLTVTVRQNGWQLLRQTIADDGNVSGNGKVGRPQPVSVTLPFPDTGVLTFDLSTSEDVIIRNITSFQHTLAFQNRVFLADGPGYIQGASFSPSALTTNGVIVKFEAIHNSGVQTILAGGKPVSLSGVRLAASIQLPEGVKNVTIPRSDIIVTSDRLVALAPATFFQPVAVATLPEVPEQDLNPFDYVLTQYAPKQFGGPLTVDETFDTSDLPPGPRSFTVRLITPGLVAKQRRLQVVGAEVSVMRRPIHWPGVISRIRSWFKG